MSLLLAARWIFQIEWIAHAIPGSADMGINAPVLFAACGLCCMARPESTTRKGTLDWIALACACLVILVSAATLVEHLSPLNLGIDFVRKPTPPTEQVPHPGRLAPNTAMAFFCAGFALLASRRPGRHSAWALVLPTAVTLIGFAGLVGYLLGLERLYQIANFNRMVAPTAVGLTLLGLTLFLRPDTQATEPLRDLNQHLGRITRRSSPSSRWSPWRPALPASLSFATRSRRP